MNHAEWLRGGLGLGPADTPFPWQDDLLHRFQDGQIPRALDIPTGLGKTSVMAIWLVARALGARVPRRLVYVVDRRAVVDQATTVALALRRFVSDTPDIKGALGLQRDLPISTLRGQHLDNREWLDDPAAPAIVVGTVDMVGSRLLFEGYGVSWKMRPYHAGLLGSDTLLVLDEAHLVPPFERLLEAVAAANDRGLGPSPAAAGWIPSLVLLALSATGQSDGEAVGLSPADHAHPVVRKRIHAVKALDVRPPVSKADLALRLAEEAHGMASRSADPVRIIVFCDTRDDANKAHREIARLGGKSIRPLELFVGGRRAYEREALATWLHDYGFLAGGASPKQTAFLVATSAAEVGVDLDADAAVADVVAWERMVQRLGRVNRRGNVNAKVVLIPIAGEERSPAQRQASLALLERLSSTDGGVQGSPAALVELRERASADPELRKLIETATTQAPLHPPLTRALVDAWAMTSLEVHTGRPEIDPWLRGWVEDDEPHLTMAFREYLPLLGMTRAFPDQALQAFLEAAGPHASEQLDVEVKRALDWLERSIARQEKVERDADDETSNDARPWAIAVRPRPLRCELLTLRALADKRSRANLEKWILPGATLLVDARLGGLSSGLLDDQVNALAREFGSNDLTWPGQTLPQNSVPFRVRRITSPDEACLQGFEPDKSFPVGRDDEGAVTAWLRVERRADDQAQSETGRSVASREQSLTEHQRWVEDEAKDIATRLGFDTTSEVSQILRLAGRLHDEGKRAQRWQRAFHAKVGEAPIAKSVRAPNVTLLGGYRHELGSLAYVERDPEFAALGEELRDLVLHLVAAHHGRARPILPIDGAEEAPTQLTKRVQEVALRFDRLSRRYGPWGLAWLESLLRAADQRASRRNDQRGRDG